MSDIVVVGSINTDLVFVSNKRPKAGETLIGKEFLTIPGGKGANQAVAASRLGADVSMIGCVGKDIYGKKMLDNFRDNGINYQAVKEMKTSTGVAGIMVDQEDNSIVVIPGANALVDISLIEENISLILNSKIVVLQLEIPLKTVEYVIRLCHEHHIMTILNPAPACKLSGEIIEKVSYITPNEHEAYEMFGTNNISELLMSYPNKLIITQGENGVAYHDGHNIVNVPSMIVDVVDTTGAGDTFNGALAICLITKKSLFESIKFANKVAAISITKYGAQGGMPNINEVEGWK